jgi:hypothetical protein
MKFNKWTMGLAAIGVVSLASAARADESPMNQVQTALSKTTLSGYIDTAAVFNPGGVGEGYNYSYSAHGNALGGNGSTSGPGYYSFAKANGFYLNSVDIALDKPQDESPWASGYHAELMFGPDATPSSQGPGPGAQTVNIRQAYLALRTPIGNTAIDWKVGVFDTIIGYESTTDGNNPNYTRSYGYTMEPTTHTGVLATFKAADWISFSAGVADTTYNWGYLPGVNSGTSVDAMNYPTAMGSIALTAPDSWGWAKGATFNAGVINSPSSNNGGATSFYAGATVPTPLTALKVGASFDYLDMHNQYSQYNYNPANDNIWVVGAYASYQFNDKLSFNVRGEYLNQQGAGAYSGTYLVPKVDNSYYYGGYYETKPNVEEFTATVQYQIWANVLSRAEFRWDHCESGTPFAYSSSGYYGTKNAYMLAINLIYQF